MIVAKAIWNGAVLAESYHTDIVEVNHYFPLDTIKKEYFKESDHHGIAYAPGKERPVTTISRWTGGKVNENAAWYYPDPKKSAEQIKDHVAFWNGVEIIE